jgi:hypothetical protein
LRELSTFFPYHLLFEFVSADEGKRKPGMAASSFVKERLEFVKIQKQPVARVVSILRLELEERRDCRQLVGTAKARRV